MYNKFKILIYSISYALILFFYFKSGIKGFMHTLPPVFAVSAIIFLVSLSWIIIDIILSRILELYKSNLKIHINSILLSLIVCIVIIIVAFY